MLHHRLVRKVIIRAAGLATALFVGLVVSAEGALAVRPRDPGAVTDSGAAVPTPAIAPFDVFGQPWQVALAVVVAALAVTVLIVTSRRPHRVASV